MPPKRKALAVVDVNKEVAPPPSKKAARGVAAVNSKKGKEKEAEKEVEKLKKATKPAKGTQGTKGANGAKTVEPPTAAKAPKSADAPKISGAPKVVKAKNFKYCNADTLSEASRLEFVNVAWPQDNEGECDGNDGDIQPGDPKLGDILTVDMIKRVSKMGFPITTDGEAKFRWLVEEQEKRDQDLHGMYIYNDFSGYGTGEVINNLLADFNKILFKKEVSPFKKWAHIEGLATFFKLDCLGFWMMIDDSQGLKEVINMIGTIFLTSLEMLSEHSLLANDSPLPNIGIIALLLIEFVREDAVDLDIMWAHEVVRALDKAGVELNPRKEVSVTKEHLDEWRAQYKQKEDDEVEDGMNIYEFHAANKKWKPDDDMEVVLGEDERMWARWDWKKEYKEFKEDHVGGNHFNLEKWSKSKKASYTFGTKECEARMSF